MHRGHVIGGAEHYVFVHRDKRRVLKQTKPNRWGFRFDTPLDYLARLNCLTSYAEGLKIVMEGIAVEKGVPSLITSMAYVAGKHPDSQQLAAHFKKNEWRLLPDPTGLLVYRHDETGVVYRDRGRSGLDRGGVESRGDADGFPAHADEGFVGGDF